MRGETAAPAPMGALPRLAGGTLHPLPVAGRGWAAAGSLLPGLGQSYQITVTVSVNVNCSYNQNNSVDKLGLCLVICDWRECLSSEDAGAE